MAKIGLERPKRYKEIWSSLEGKQIVKMNRNYVIIYFIKVFFKDFGEACDYFIEILNAPECLNML